MYFLLPKTGNLGDIDESEVRIYAWYGLRHGHVKIM